MQNSPRPLGAALVRLIDANFNRACEGWRTLEDLARFILDAGESAGHFKALRHELTAAVAPRIAAERYAGRDAAGDVGRDATASAQLPRRRIVDIAEAAAARCQQALRVIEEAAAVEAPDIVAAVAALRYRAYDAHAQLLQSLQRADLSTARLYVLADCRLEVSQFARRIAEIAAGGADLIQIRDKHRETSELLLYITAAIEAIGDAPTRLIVNDRVDVAAATQVAGVHLGQDDLPVAAARRLLSSQQLIGYSTHDVDQLAAALELEIDYVGCGPTFPGQTKAFERYAGLDYLRQAAGVAAAAGTRYPLYAIGGITLATLPQVLECGITHVAVSGAIWLADDPRDAAARFADQLR